jgi:hypothetical protein
LIAPRALTPLVLAACVSLACAAAPPDPPASSGADASPAALGVFDSLFNRAYAQRWDTLAIGERVGRFALALEGRPYADGTLEGPGPEVCRVTGTGFDCVTFMETCLALAQLTAPGSAALPRPTSADLIVAVTRTRYRGGVLDGYVSRLHYTSEWIADNAKRGVLDDVSAALGGIALPLEVGFMSSHPDAYPALRGLPERVERIREIEARIRALDIAFIPRERVAAIEPQLRTGDLVAIATSIAGLDYAHTGLIWRDSAGVARFVHASSAGGRVVVDRAPHEYLAGGPKHHTGITVARPREVAARGD